MGPHPILLGLDGFAFLAILVGHFTYAIRQGRQ